MSAAVLAIDLRAEAAKLREAVARRQALDAELLEAVTRRQALNAELLERATALERIAATLDAGVELVELEGAAKTLDWEYARLQKFVKRRGVGRAIGRKVYVEKSWVDARLADGRGGD